MLSSILSKPARHYQLNQLMNSIEQTPIGDLLKWFDMDLPLVKTTMHTHTCAQLNGAQRGGSTVKRKFTNLGDDVVANGHNFDAAKILSISIFKRKKRSFSCRAEYEITSTSISMNIKLQLLDTSSAIQLANNLKPGSWIGTQQQSSQSFVSWFSRIKVANFLSLSPLCITASKSIEFFFQKSFKI